MSDYIMDTYDITCEKTGWRFRVEITHDSWMGAPHEEHCCHGIVVPLDYDPHDEGDVEDVLADRYDDITEMAMRASLAEMEELSSRQRGEPTLYYDVWATRKLAADEGWGPGADWDAQHPNATPAERLTAAIMHDVEYLRGWYNDEWCWAVLSVTPYDPESEDDELLSGYTTSCGGYEYGYRPNGELREEALRLIDECVHEMTKDGLLNPTGLVGAT